DLARVDSNTHVYAQRVDGLNDRGSAAHGARRPVECREKAIAEGLDRAATKTRELLAHHSVVVIDQGAPLPVAKLSGPLRRFDNIREHHRCKHAVSFDLASRTRQELLGFTSDTIDHLGLVYEQMILTGQDGHPCTGYVVRNIASRINRHTCVARSV